MRWSRCFQMENFICILFVINSRQQLFEGIDTRFDQFDRLIQFYEDDTRRTCKGVCTVYVARHKRRGTARQRQERGPSPVSSSALLTNPILRATWLQKRYIIRIFSIVNVIFEVGTIVQAFQAKKYFRNCINYFNSTFKLIRVYRISIILSQLLEHGKYYIYKWS